MSEPPLPALVPAAGRSERMGRPKLVLPLADGQTVIARLVRALREGGAGPVVVIAPPRGTAWADGLAREAERAGAEVVFCDAPTADMRATVEVGLKALPDDHLGAMLVPADSPGVTAAVVAAVRRAFQARPDRIVAPTDQGKRGHPIALPRRLWDRVQALAPGVGINAVVRDPQEVIEYVAVEAPRLGEDLDTPEDYARWLAEAPGA